MDKIEILLIRAVELVLSRAGDVSTEDGDFATVGTDEVIRLEAAIVDAFELDSDDVTNSDMLHICEMMKKIK